MGKVTLKVLREGIVRQIGTNPAKGRAAYLESIGRLFERVGGGRANDIDLDEAGNDYSLPECEENDRLDGREFGHRVCGGQIVGVRQVKEHQTVHGPQLAKVLNGRKVAIAGADEWKIRIINYDEMGRERWRKVKRMKASQVLLDILCQEQKIDCDTSRVRTWKLREWKSETGENAPVDPRPVAFVK